MISVPRSSVSEKYCKRSIYGARPSTAFLISGSASPYFSLRAGSALTHSVKRFSVASFVSRTFSFFSPRLSPIEFFQ